MNGFGNGEASSSKVEGFKTYKPRESDVVPSHTETYVSAALAETYLRRSPLPDPHPDSAFAPLPSGLNIHLHRKDKDKERAAQRAEVDRLLQPGYRTSLDGDGLTSMAGPSRNTRTMTSPRKALNGIGGNNMRTTQSMGAFQGIRPMGSGRGGVYLDASGHIHDRDYDPFAKVAEMSKAKSRRKSAFGTDRRKASSSTVSTASASDAGNEPNGVSDSADAADKSPEQVQEDDLKTRQEVERRKQEELSSVTVAKRRSILSDRSSVTGRATPSLRSSDDGSAVPTSSALDRFNSKSRSRTITSPFTPGYNHLTATTTSSFAARTQLSSVGDSPPQKTSEVTSPHSTYHRSRAKTPNSTIVNDKKITVTGFDAPVTPVLPSLPQPDSVASHIDGNKLKVPNSGRMSVASRRSTDSARPRPLERAREDIFPETPAQLKRREDRERRSGKVGPSGVNTLTSRVGSLAIDTSLTSSGGRILPEIEIVEDDDPRIVFPEGGKTTRVQKTHDHVIRGPFSHALQAQSSGGSVLGRQSSPDLARIASVQSQPGAAGGSGSRPPSSFLDGPSGYLPSRWATGDRDLRTTEEAKDKYRPLEWKPGDPSTHDDWK